MKGKEYPLTITITAREGFILRQALMHFPSDMYEDDVEMEKDIADLHRRIPRPTGKEPVTI